MKALTVQQPWAWAIVRGGKDVENRTQAWSYRGPLAIHAGARWSRRGGESLLVRRACWDFYGTDAPVRDHTRWWSRESPGVLGAIIGVVDLVDVHPAEQTGASVTAWADWCCAPWGEGHYAERHGSGWRQRTDVVHLVLENPRPLEVPIPCTGRLGLWTPSAHVLGELEVAAR